MCGLILMCSFFTSTFNDCEQWCHLFNSNDERRNVMNHCQKSRKSTRGNTAALMFMIVKLWK